MVCESKLSEKGSLDSFVKANSHVDQCLLVCFCFPSNLLWHRLALKSRKGNEWTRTRC